MEASRAWLARAVTAPPDPAWVCGSCGARAASWRPRCGNCESFDTLAWTAPPQVEAAPEIAPGLAPPAAKLPALAAPEAQTPAPPAPTLPAPTLPALTRPS
jgi:HemY protein